MKRKIALLIIMILALSFAFAACNQRAATTVAVRWDTETHVFNITLADFADEDKLLSAPFKYYHANSYDDVEETVYVSGESSLYSKDIAFTNEFKGLDEITPLAVNGSYRIDIAPGPSYCDVTTLQEMCVVYSKHHIKNSELLDTKTGALATDEQKAKYPIEDTFNGETVTLWSSTETAVRFENLPKQKPLSSSVKVNGFYVGTVTQQLSRYETSTEYVYDSGKKPIAKITLNGEQDEYTFPSNAEGRFIDSNQILMYLRSLNKTSNFQDSPAISVFNPFSKTLQTANFAMSHDYRVILTDNDKVLATNLSVVSVTVGNNPFMMQENLTEKLAQKDLDLHSTVELGVKESKFTTVRFRVGYLAFEIDYGNDANTANWSDIWAALIPVVEEE